MITAAPAYPFKAFALKKSMAVREVTLVKEHWLTGHWGADGEAYGDHELYDTAEAAIAGGRELLAKRRQRLRNQLDNVERHAAVLDLAEKQFNITKEQDQ